MCMSVLNKQIIGFLRTERLPSFVLSLGTLHSSADGKQAKHAVRTLWGSTQPAEVPPEALDTDGGECMLFHFLGE